jgi:predicted TIM-barrel fold metal-dependent hydrolase
MHPDAVPAVSRRALLAAGAGLAASGLGLGADAPEVIIDIHPHIISKDTSRYPPQPFRGNQSDWSRERPQTFEEYVAQMDAAGVAKAAIVQASTYYGVDNSYLADSIAIDPRRFAGVCSIDTLAADAVPDLERWMKRGMSGLRIYTGRTDTAMLIDPRAFPVWEYAQAHGIPVCISTQAPGIPNVRLLLQRFPRATVVLDHAASPALDDGPPYRAAQPLFELAGFRNLYLKITPRAFERARSSRATPDTFFPKLVEVFGASRLAFGSNLPSDAGPLSRLIAEARTCLAALSLADRAMILSGTARRLYPVLS